MGEPLSRQIIAEFAQECKGAKVQAILLGGAACFALGNDRATQDMDVVIPAPVDKQLDTLVKYSKKFKQYTDPHGVPVFTFGDMEIDAFDPDMWVHRPQYKQFLAPGGHISVDVKGTPVDVVHPALMLREKLISFGDRSGPKHITDGQDISFLVNYCRDHDYQLDISVNDSDGVNKPARESLAKFMVEYKYSEQQKEDLKKVIKW